MKNPTYRFEIIPKSWTKRRTAKPVPQPISVEIPDFELKEQYFCNMNVLFENGSKQALYARVLCNYITNQWTVDGMHVAVNMFEVKAKIKD